jgi:hypothetical protein
LWHHAALIAREFRQIMPIFPLYSLSMPARLRAGKGG